MRTTCARITPSAVLLTVLFCLLLAETPEAAGHSRQARPETGSEASVKEFNSIVLKCIHDGDARPMEELVDWSAIDAAISNGIQCHPEMRSVFLNRLRLTFVQNWVDARHRDSKRGSFEFRRTVTLNGKLNLIYRMITDEGAGSYDALEVARDSSGQVRITDFNDVLRGAGLVDVSRDRLTLITSVIGLKIEAKPSQSQVAGLSQIEQLHQLRRDIQAGQANAVIKSYDALPEEFKACSESLHCRMLALEQLAPGSEQHLDAIKKLAALSKTSWNGDFLRFHGATYGRDSQTAVLMGNKLKKVLGPDAWIDSEIGACYLLAGDYVTARKYGASAIRTEPEMWSPWLIEFEACVQTSNFPQAVAALNRLHGFKRLPDPARLEARADLEMLTKSEVYQTWKNEWLLSEQEAAEARDRETTKLFEEFEANR